MNDEHGTETEAVESAEDEPLDAAEGEDPSVLVVDDEPRVCEAFELWLRDDYRVLTATSGEAALDQMSDRIDVVLLDRHMPGLSGDEVLTRLREADYDCRVAMVTAVDPDLDIVEMPFDHYVSKPVDGETLQNVVERLLQIGRYGDRMTDLYGIIQKIVTLESEKTRSELSDSERYARLAERRDRLQEQMDDIIASLDADEVGYLFETTSGPQE